MTRQEYTVVTVTLEDRDDGGLRVWSDDLPGLVLSGPDKENVCECIAPAIQAIFGHRGLHDAIVHPARPLAEILAHASPRDVDMHVEQYVVEVPKAA